MPFQKTSSRLHEFQPGHTLWKNRKPSAGATADSTTGPSHRMRLSQDLHDLTLGADLHENAGATLPTFLRPRRPEQPVADPFAENVDTVCGNRIFAVPELLHSFSDFVLKHSVAKEGCVASFSFEKNDETLRGLCASEHIKCLNCGFKAGPYKMYREVEKVNGQKGFGWGATNVQLQTAMTKLSIGYTQVRLLFSGIDVPPPAISGMQKIANRVSETCVRTNREAMLDNQKTLGKVMELHGASLSATDYVPSISVETDVAYNNPPKGRSMTQPGTQAYAPLIENVTKKKMVIAFSVASKQCSTAIALRNKGFDIECPHHEGRCFASWPENTPLGNVETKLSEQNAAFLKHVGVKCVCTDNDSGLVNGIRRHYPGASKEDCCVHVSRGQRRFFFRNQLSVDFYKHYPSLPRNLVSSIVSNAIAKRCSAELRNGKAKDSDMTKFQSRILQAKFNILRCFCGVHNQCKNTSYVCNGSARCTKTILSSLPNKQWLSLTLKDKAVLLKTIDYKLSPEMVSRQQQLMTTNKSEATHLRVFKSLPKSRHWLRHFEGRAHSAIHSASVGCGKSLETLNQKLGAPLSSAAAHSLNRMDKSEQSKSKKRKENKSKHKRKQSQQKKTLQKCAYHSGYKTGMLHPSVKKEHAYSLRF